MPIVALPHPTASALSRRGFLGVSLGTALSIAPFSRAVARAASASGYRLPFPGGVAWQVIQGNNGAESHSGRSAFSWDFNMPQGSPLTAARAGVVWMLKQDSNSNCRDLSCPELNNYVVVDHGDGASSLYMHGMQNGARVRVGQRVEQGELLFLSGNTGQSNGPHLHFQVQHNDPRQYLAQSFAITFDDVDVDGGVPLLGHWYRSGNTKLLDFDVPGGHFFTQANGSGGGGGKGFSVTDEQDVPIWTSLQRLGSWPVAGYPISQRFQMNGYVYQAFQKAVLEWHPAEKQMQLMAVMDALHDGGSDSWLLQQFGIPVEADFSAADAGRDPSQTATAHQALLDAARAVRAAYFAAPDPVARFGLPMSGLLELADAQALRTQRAVFQLWKRDVPWGKAGQVTTMSVGEIARDAQLFPADAIVPEARLNEELSTDTRLPWQRGLGHGAGTPSGH